MIPRSIRFVLFTVCLFTAGTLLSQVPEGGTQLNSVSGTTWQKIGRCSVSAVPVEGQAFAQAIRMETGEGLVNSWDAQLKFPAVAGVAAGDVVLVAFWARTTSSVEETGEGFLNVIIEHNVTYIKELSHSMSIGNEWTEYYAPVVIGNALATSQVSYLFHMGFNSQVVEVAEVRFLDYGTTLQLEDLPVTEITYAGRDPDAAWRAEADARIGQVRKGQMKVRVVDAQGVALPGAGIRIEMIRHRFGFGTAVVAGRITTSQVYREHLYDMFNEAVFENDLKWPPFENESTHPAILKALDTLDARGIRVRGHNVIWPSYTYMPDFMQDLAGDPVGMNNAINARIDEVVSFTSGRLIDWDVINEPYSEHDVQDILGDGVMADWFKRTRRNDRTVKLYLNEFLILSGGGRNITKQDSCYNTIRFIDSLGGGVDGIGMQGHLSSELTSIERVYDIVDRFAQLGKEIKVTEFDIDLNQREVQADYTRDFMTILFSHPSVKGILTWGFWAGAHWKPDAAFFDPDWNLRPHGEVWRDLVRNRWWTPVMDTVSDGEGNFSFEGFLGTYDYTVTSGDTVRTGTFTLDHSHMSGITDSVMISMDAAFPETVEIVPDRPGFLCEGEGVALRAPEGEGLSYTWTRDWEVLQDTGSSIVAVDSGSYAVTVEKNGMVLVSLPYRVEVRPRPQVTLAIEGDDTFCPGGTGIIVAAGEGDLEYDWYDQNSIVQSGTERLETGTGGAFYAVATLNGCSAETEPVVLTRLEASDPICTVSINGEKIPARVYPNPCRGSVQVDLGPGMDGPGTIELVDAWGRVLDSRQVGPGTLQTTLSIPVPGIYLLRVTGEGRPETHHVVVSGAL
jgi:endo-1,4-beta-xylanase